MHIKSRVVDKNFFIFILKRRYAPQRKRPDFTKIISVLFKWERSEFNWIIL